MEERDFEALEALWQTKNITKAADKIYTTQSALSKRLASLEEELGVTMFLRSRQGISFTPDGETVLEYSRKARGNLKEMREALSRNKEYLCGTLNAGFSINFAQYKLPDLLRLFTTEHPHVKLHVMTDQSRNIYARLVRGEVDVAVVRGEYPWKEHKFLLSRERICAIKSRSDSGKPLSCLRYIDRQTDAAFTEEAGQWLRENGLQLDREGICVDDLSTCVELVGKGLGWAIVPEICLGSFQGEITPLSFKDGEPFTRSTYLMCSKSAAGLAQVQAFIGIARKTEE